MGWEIIISGFQSYCPLELPAEIKQTKEQQQQQQLRFPPEPGQLKA